MSRKAEKRGLLGRVMRVLTTLLLCPIILLWAIIILLYAPPVQKYVVEKVCDIAGEASGLEIEIGAFHLTFPLSVSVDDFKVSKQENKLLEGQQIEVDIQILPLLRGEIEVNYISIDQTKVNSHDLIEGVGIDGKIGHFRITARNIDPAAEEAMIRHLHITDTYANITLGEMPEEREDSTSTPLGWIVKLHRAGIHNLKVNLAIPHDSIAITAAIDHMMLRGAKADLGNNVYSLKNFMLKDSRVAYDRGTQSDSIAPLDHIHIEDIDIATGEISYAAPLMGATIKQITLSQKGGMRIEKGYMTLSADSNNIHLNDIKIGTKHGTAISGSGTLPWQILKGKSGGNMRGNIKVHIDKRDMRKFIAADSYSALHILPDSMLDAHIDMHGNLNKMIIDTLYANIPHLAHIGANGSAKNLNKITKVDAQMNIKGYVADLNRIIHSRFSPDSIARQQLGIIGNISIIEKRCSLSLGARNGDGRAAVRASYDIADESYDAKVRVKRLNISEILPEVPLHELTAMLNAEGRGFNPLDSLTRYSCNLRIDTIHYDSILLSHMQFDAIQEKNLSQIELDMQDPNLQMRLKAETRLDSTAIDNKTHIAVTRAALKQIGLSTTPIDGEMQLDIEAFTDMKQRHSARIAGDNFILIAREERYTPERLEMECYTSPDTSYMSVKSGDLRIDGTIDTGYEVLLASLERIGKLFRENATSGNNVYHIQDFEREMPSLSLDIECGKNNLLSNYLRFNSVEFNNIDLQLTLDSIRGINGRGGIYNLKRGDLQLDTISFSLRQKDHILRYFAGVRTRSLDPAQPKLKFYSALFGSMHNDSLTTSFVFRDNNENTGARLKLNTILRPWGLRFHFDPEATLFNRPFRFNKENYVTLNKEYAVRADIEFKDSLDSGLRIYSSSDTTQLRDIGIELFNIDLKSTTAMLPYVPDIAGALNMDIHYRDNDTSMIASGDIYGTDIIYEGTPMGDGSIELAYIPKGDKQHCVDVTIHHNNEEIFNLSGDYHNDSISPTIDGEAIITRFPLQLSKAFMKDSDIALFGYIDGNLAVKGKVDDMDANGYIHFDSVYADAPSFGTRLHLNDDRVEIDNNKLTFKNFDIYAKGSTPFQVNGTIDMENLLVPEFNLRMRANEYELVNAKREKSSTLYGRMFINFNSYVRGPINALSMNGSATLLGKSDITYVMQETPLAAENQLDGLVQFVNFADTTQVAKSGDEVEEIDFGNLTMNMTLNIEEAARINADFDANRNSYIELQGGGTLNLTYTSEAGLGLTGRYTLSDGQLKYALPIIPLKTFNISDGSYVNWSGDLMNPTLNITALERITSSVVMDDGNSQAVAFNVGVVLTNTLDNMGLSFTLSAPENAAVQNELNALDKETLNKYAVTMLITGAYIGNNGGLTVSSALSSFLDATINDIAGNAGKSFDINVGITDVEDIETGSTYKNYSFSFAKRFWNDRLTVVIGGEVNSGETQNRNESFINNVSLEWKINEAGNRYIRLFYDKNYESILEGEIIETGVGYVYKRKLDNLKELFIFRKKDDSEQLILQQSPLYNNRNEKR